MSRFLILLAMPLFSGCLAYGYPSYTYTPKVTELPEDVRAFKLSNHLHGTSVVMKGGETKDYDAEEISIKNGCLQTLHESQFQYYAGGIPVTFLDLSDWKVVLYRPGYENIEIPSRWSGREWLEDQTMIAIWKPAKDLYSQIEALEVFEKRNSMTMRSFVSEEYLRLSDSDWVTTEDQRALLNRKAAAALKR